MSRRDVALHRAEQANLVVTELSESPVRHCEAAKPAEATL